MHELITQAITISGAYYLDLLDINHIGKILTHDLFNIFSPLTFQYVILEEDLLEDHKKGEYKEEDEQNAGETASAAACMRRLFFKVKLRLVLPRTYRGAAFFARVSFPTFGCAANLLAACHQKGDYHHNDN